MTWQRVPADVRKGLGIICIAVVMASSFAVAYTVALARPIPRHVPLGVVGPASIALAVVEKMEAGRHGFILRFYPSRQAALADVDRQKISGVLDASVTPPELLISSASDPSTARVLAQLDQVAPGQLLVPFVDVHPLPPSDPAGLSTFYVVIAATILGFVTMFQLRANVKTLSVQQWLALLATLAVVGGAALAVASGPVLKAVPAPFGELWLLLSLHIAIAALFNSTMLVLIGRWAIIPTWLWFIILGNTSSGGAVSPSLLPQPFALLHNALPTGATVSAIHTAAYFPHDQRLQPFAVIAAWLCITFAALLISAQVLHRTPVE
ncbi:MAG: hypothetical protein JWR32_5866 [Mycobacterium sp.]|nr:hypothetical protein [Mycobacterium sp.]